MRLIEKSIASSVYDALNESFDPDKTAKRIARYKEFDNGHVLHSWLEDKTAEEVEELARQESIKNPEDVYYVQYDDVMNSSNDIRWLNGEKYVGGGFHYVNGKPVHHTSEEYDLVRRGEKTWEDIAREKINESEEVKEEKKVTKVEVDILPTVKFLWAEGNQDHVKALFGSAEEHDMDFSKFQNAVYVLDQEVSERDGGYDKVKYVANIQVKFTYEDGSTNEETSTYTGRVDCGDGYKYVTVSKNMKHFIQEEFKDAEVIVREDSTAELKESTSFDNIVLDSYNHLTNDLGKNPTIDDIVDDILNNYDQDYINDNTPEDSLQASKDVKYILRNNNLDFEDLNESADLDMKAFKDRVLAVYEKLAKKSTPVSVFEIWDELRNGKDSEKNDEFFPGTEELDNFDEDYDVIRKILKGKNLKESEDVKRDLAIEPGSDEEHALNDLYNGKKLDWTELSGSDQTAVEHFLSTYGKDFTGKSWNDVESEIRSACHEIGYANEELINNGYWTDGDMDPEPNEKNVADYIFYNYFLKKINESAGDEGMSLKEYAMKFHEGDIDMDVSDTEIDMVVAFVYNFNNTHEDNYDRFLNLLGERAKVVKVNKWNLVCDFSSVFKPYEDKLQNFFNMEYSEFDEAWAEAVLNLEGLIPGMSGEKTYGELIDILEGK